LFAFFKKRFSFPNELPFFNFYCHTYRTFAKSTSTIFCSQRDTMFLPSFFH
jgi:hypothetical protein